MHITLYAQQGFQLLRILQLTPTPILSDKHVTLFLFVAGACHKFRDVAILPAKCTCVKAGRQACYSQWWCTKPTVINRTGIKLFGSIGAAVIFQLLPSPTFHFLQFYLHLIMFSTEW